jgi:hypothetical protein
MVPYPHLSDARFVGDDLPYDLCEFRPFEAALLTPNSLVAVAFTMASYTFKPGGISAKLEHVYLVKLEPDARDVLQATTKKKVVTLSDSSDDE